MLGFALRRLGLALLVALAVSAVTFTLLNLSGDPAVAIAGEGAREADVEAVRAQYGLDRPLPVRYVEWLGGVLTGDLGYSNYLRRGVASVIAEHAPVTMALGALALAFALLLAVPLGVVAALRPGGAVDQVALTVAVVGQALPTFWFALLMIYLFGVELRWLPISGSGTPAHFVMPAVALGYYATPAIMRLTRAGMRETLEADYIRTARAKGLPAGVVLFKHALRNAVIPVVSLAAVQLGFMLGGSIVIETIFALNGLGSLAWRSIQRADFEVMQAIVLVLAAFYILLTLLADLLNAWLDPRLRAGG